MRKALSPLLTLALVVVVGFAAWHVGYAEQEKGKVQASLDSVKAVIPKLLAAARHYDTLYVRDTLRLRSTLTRWDTTRVRDTLTRNDTVFVPREVADSVIAACTAALRTCEQRVAAVWDVANGYKRQAELEHALAARPWTSVGLDFDGRWGGYVDRDWSRFRVGLSITPAPQDARVGIRLGVRW